MTKATSVRPRDERSTARLQMYCAGLVMGWLAVMLVLGPTAALADCRPVGGSNFLCSGATSAPQIISLDDATVVTAPGFGVAVPPSHAAMLIEGSGALSYLDIHGAVLSGPLLVENTGGVGTVSIISNGTFGGIAAFNDGPGATTIALTGEVNGADFGIFALNNKGSINVSASGPVRTPGPVGMLLAAPGDIAAAVADVYGTDLGLMVATDVGVVTVTSTGTIAGLNGVGLEAVIGNSVSSSDMVLDLHSVIGGAIGVIAVNEGTGATWITVNGLVEGMTGILTQSFSGGRAQISNKGHVRSTEGVRGLAVDTEETQPTMLVNNGQLTGTLDLSDFGDLVINAGVWLVSGENYFGDGHDRLINQSGATIVAAHDADLAELTVLRKVDEFSGGGTVSLRDGGGGDFFIVEGSANFALGAVHTLDIGATADWIGANGAVDIIGTDLRVALLADTVIGQTFRVLTPVVALADPMPASMAIPPIWGSSTVMMPIMPTCRWCSIPRSRCRPAHPTNAQQRRRWRAWR